MTLLDGTVTAVKPFDCGSGGVGPDNQPTVDGDCAKVTAETDDGDATFTLDSARYQAGIDTGDEIEVLRIAPQGQPATFEFYDFQRTFPLQALAIAFAVLVVAVARWRGLFALVGIGVTLVALMQFILPALLAGKSALPVAIVGSTVIMTVVLYLAHGVSIRTTSALFGTYFGIIGTALMGALATDWASLTGIGSEDDRTLVATVPTLSMSGVVAATMVIAGLGVLNDVTVTQASAVWEMRALQPTARARELFMSAMRIGRDHIASSVYTLVFAYAGSAMTVLLLISAYSRPLGEMATTEELGQEIVRTLVGAIMGTVALGLYSAAAALASLPGMMGTGIAAVLLPRIAAAQADPARERALVRRWVAGATAVLGALTVVLVLSADWIIVLAFGRAFESAVPVAHWLVAASGLLGLRRVLVAVLQGRDRGAVASRIELALTPVLVVAIVLAARADAVEAVGVAMLVTAVASVTALTVALRLTSPTRRRDVSRAGVAA